MLSGCGENEPTDEEQVRTTLTAFSRATAAKDYQALCDKLLAPSLIADLKKIGLPCGIALQQGLGDVRQPRLIVGDGHRQGQDGGRRGPDDRRGRAAVEGHGRARAHRRGLADRVAVDAVRARTGAVGPSSAFRPVGLRWRAGREG